MEIEIEGSLLGCSIAVFILRDENHQAHRAVFVDTRLEEFLDIAQLKMAELFRDGSLHRHGDSDELVAFSVLTFAGFEEPSQIARAFRILGACEFPL